MKKIDIAKLSYSEFIDHLFVKRLDSVRDDEGRAEFDCCTDFSIFINHITVSFLESENLVQTYGIKQYAAYIGNLGTWLIEDQEYFFDDPAMTEKIITLIKASAVVYLVVINNHPIKEMPGDFSMFWDTVSHCAQDDFDLYNELKQLVKSGDIYDNSLRKKAIDMIDAWFKKQTEDRRNIMDQILRTLTTILYYGDNRIKGYAIHGIGHLQHPQKMMVLEKFINENKDKEILQNSLEYIYKAETGVLM